MGTAIAGLGGALAFVLIGGCLVGLVVFIILFAAQQSKKTLATFAASAGQLGLTLEGARSASRVRAGIAAQIVLASESRGSGKSRRTVSVTRYFAKPPAPLRMNLVVTPQLAFFGDVADALGISSDIVIGEPGFDAAFRVAATEPELARSVLRGDAGLNLLHATSAGRVRADDHVVRMQHDGWDVQPAIIARNLELVEAAARSLAEARARVAASWEDECRRVWSSLANAEGLEFDPGATRVHGAKSGAGIWLFVDTEKGAYRTRLIARFATPLDIGLSVYPTRFMQSVSKLLGAQDVRVGHSAFDEAYTVKAADADAARAVLTTDVAEALAMLLAGAEDVRVDDDGLTLHVPGIQLDPRSLSAILRDAITVATLRRAPASAGAFR